MIDRPHKAIVWQAPMHTRSLATLRMDSVRRNLSKAAKRRSEKSSCGPASGAGGQGCAGDGHLDAGVTYTLLQVWHTHVAQAHVAE